MENTKKPMYSNFKKFESKGRIVILLCIIKVKVLIAPNEFGNDQLNLVKLLNYPIVKLMVLFFKSKMSIFTMDC